MMNNLLVAQSGGPTAAINATVVGVLEMAKLSDRIDKVYGAKYGIKGVFEENFIDLEALQHNTKQLDILKQTPAAVLGSCRFKLGKSGDGNLEGQCAKIVEILRKHEINYFVYIGGNDSMDTVSKLSTYCEKHGIEDIKVIGAPKTIDNDLVGTDHCPGFGSAAKYIATTVMELERDVAVYDIPAVTVVEIMGRNAGWLTASTALARANGGKGPSLIYLCEREFDVDRFIEDVKDKIEKENGILVAVSEGIKNAEGTYISELYKPNIVDEFGHGYLAGVGQVLTDIIRERIGCKVRAVELNLMQRCAAHIASATDLEESRMLGMKAVNAALEGKTGVMVAIKRLPSKDYAINFCYADVNEVANAEKTVPLDWITEDGHDVTDELYDYLYPLIEGERRIRFKNGIPNEISIL